MKRLITKNYLIPFMFFEIFLLPVWQLGPISFKISLVIIFGSIIKGIPKPKVIGIFFLLILFLWIGKMYSFHFLYQTSINETIRISINFMIIISAYLFAKKVKIPDNLNWLVSLNILFGVINILVFVFGPNLPFLISFYSLDLRLEEGLFFVRNPGILTNPNVSAMASNLLFLFYVVANNNNLISLRNKFWSPTVFSISLLSLLSFQSRSGFIAFGLISLWMLLKNFQLIQIIKSGWKLVLFPIIIFFGFKTYMPNEYKIIKNSVDLLSNFDTALIQEINRDSRQDGSRIYKLYAAYENFKISPLFGVGSDREDNVRINNIAYHNDFSEVLVSTGLIGLIVYIILIFYISKIELILIVPFLFPGLTNAFLFTMQIAAFYFMFVGIISKHKGLNY